MEKTSKKHLRLLVLTLGILFLMAISVAAVMKFTDSGNSVRGFRSGEFVDASQDILAEGWTFCAGRANGSNTVFANLSRDDLDSFNLRGSIDSGTMSLMISVGEASRTIDLSGGKFEMSADDMGLAALASGRIEMKLLFSEAENVVVNVNWR